MKKFIDVAGADKHLALLITQKKYFGKEGAIECFERKYLTEAFELLAVYNYTLMLQYIVILYSALSYALKGRNFLVKHRIPDLLKNIHKCVTGIKPSPYNEDGMTLMSDQKYAEELSNIFTPKELQVFLSITAKKLQIQKKLSFLGNDSILKDYGITSKESLLNELQTCFMAIEIAANDELRSGISLASPAHPGPANLKLLLAEGLMYGLYRQGIVTLKSPPDIRERVWQYAMSHESSKNPEEIKNVIKLFRFIGDRKRLEEMKERKNVPVN